VEEGSKRRGGREAEKSRRGVEDGNVGDGHGGARCNRRRAGYIRRRRHIFLGCGHHTRSLIGFGNSREDGETATAEKGMFRDVRLNAWMGWEPRINHRVGVGVGLDIPSKQSLSPSNVPVNLP
jgi:hypothetical protein